MDRITVTVFYEKAAAFIAALPSDSRQKLPTLTLKSPELDDWVAYFDVRLKARPVAVTMLLAERMESMTVPAKLPTWFDNEYGPPAVIPKAARLDGPPPAREFREGLDELRERYGADWGIKRVTDKPRRRQWQPPTDAELRALYGPKPQAEDEMDLTPATTPLQR